MSIINISAEDSKALIDLVQFIQNNHAQGKGSLANPNFTAGGEAFERIADIEKAGKADVRGGEIPAEVVKMLAQAAREISGAGEGQLLNSPKITQEIKDTCDMVLHKVLESLESYGDKSFVLYPDSKEQVYNLIKAIANKHGVKLTNAGGEEYPVDELRERAEQYTPTHYIEAGDLVIVQEDRQQPNGGISVGCYGSNLADAAKQVFYFDVETAFSNAGLKFKPTKVDPIRNTTLEAEYPKGVNIEDSRAKLIAELQKCVGEPQPSVSAPGNPSSIKPTVGKAVGE